MCTSRYLRCNSLAAANTIFILLYNSNDEELSLKDVQSEDGSQEEAKLMPPDIEEKLPWTQSSFQCTGEHSWKLEKHVNNDRHKKDSYVLNYSNYMERFYHVLYLRNFSITQQCTIEWNFKENGK